jgi:hypothetical protein
MTIFHACIPDWLDRICAWPILLYRKFKYGSAFRRIYLGHGFYTVVDPDDYYRFGRFKWHIRGNDKKMYAVRDVIVGPGKTRLRSLHREIMGNPLNFLIDHLNNIPLDNRTPNLRKATQSQNQQNINKRKNTSSRFIGVCFRTRFKKWSSHIDHNKKRIHLGYFDKEIDAAHAYDTAAAKFYGKHARLNFPHKPALSQLPKHIFYKP